MNKSKEKHGIIPSDILDDLSSRFVINVPQEERCDLTRLCFQIELAHWFYLDFYCSKNEKLVKSGERDFFRQMFNHIPSLQYHVRNVDSIIDDFRNYKQVVPTFGAILIDETLTHVLLVQSFFSKVSWGFPKGKINQDELPVNCAIREVLEETGFDISNLISEELFLETSSHDQISRLYLVAGVPYNYKFQTKTRGEIKSIQWFPIGELPNNRKDCKTIQINNTQYQIYSFHMIIPFIRQVKRFVQEQHRLKVQKKSKSRYTSLSDAETPSDFQNKTKAYKCLDLEEALVQKTRIGSASKKRLFQRGSNNTSCSSKTSIPLSNQHQTYMNIKQKSSSSTMNIKNDKKLSNNLLGTNSNLNEISKHKQDSQNVFYPKVWKDFQFDVEAIMKCFS